MGLSFVVKWRQRTKGKEPHDGARLRACEREPLSHRKSRETGKRALPSCHGAAEGYRLDTSPGDGSPRLGAWRRSKGVLPASLPVFPGDGRVVDPAWGIRPGPNSHRRVPGFDRTLSVRKPHRPQRSIPLPRRSADSIPGPSDRVSDWECPSAPRYSTGQALFVFPEGDGTMSIPLVRGAVVAQAVAAPFS
jgi:hypothetical protein